jgi:hypothetical protein
MVGRDEDETALDGGCAHDLRFEHGSAAFARGERRMLRMGV